MNASKTCSIKAIEQAQHNIANFLQWSICTELLLSGANHQAALHRSLQAGPAAQCAQC
jgi:hypothetical protein